MCRVDPFVVVLNVSHGFINIIFFHYFIKVRSCDGTQLLMNMMLLKNC